MMICFAEQNASLVERFKNRSGIPLYLSLLYLSSASCMTRRAADIVCWPSNDFPGWRSNLQGQPYSPPQAFAEKEINTWMNQNLNKDMFKTQIKMSYTKHFQYCSKFDILICKQAQEQTHKFKLNVKTQEIWISGSTH